MTNQDVYLLIGSSSSFDKLMNEEDSRSNEDSGTHTSPRISKKNPSTVNSAAPVKVESRRNSPNSCDRKIGMSKISPSLNHKDNPIGLAPSESLPVKMSPKNSSMPGTPNLHPSPIGELLNVV